LEKNQLEQALGLDALVSLSDHDCIDAPLRLRAVPETHETPVSLEWTVPFRSSKFHLGVHNLPGSRAQLLVEELEACTAHPSMQCIGDLLHTLHAIPEVLIVFNHPLWNLYGNPPAEFARNLEDFLTGNNDCLHAFELNGLRRWEENQRVTSFATRWQQVLVSGGDRHGCEPNANLNLTNAASFSEWVHELRTERRSQLLFMPQYNHSLVARCYETFLDAIREYPDHSDGCMHWDQRTYHPGRNGSVQPLSQLWTQVPGFLNAILEFARLAEATRLLSALRVCFGTHAAGASEFRGQEEGAR
jgi:hypothetical protein